MYRQTNPIDPLASSTAMVKAYPGWFYDAINLLLKGDIVSPPCHNIPKYWNLLNNNKWTICTLISLNFFYWKSLNSSHLGHDRHNNDVKLTRKH